MSRNTSTDNGLGNRSASQTRGSDYLGDVTVALVLSGGNALGAYQAGAFQALYEHGLQPDWVAGTSAGAINAAMICGNLPEQRLTSLQALWTPATEAEADTAFKVMDEARRTIASLCTATAGRADLFVPRNLLGPWWNPFGNQEPASLYDSSPMRSTFERLIDFDLLNQGAPRLSVTAVDIESGEDVVFDTDSHRIGPDHLRASSALLPAFSPVEIDGRLLVDGGISANLPLDVVLGRESDHPLLCIAVDLLPLRGPRPSSLGESIIRMQDLMFAAQTRRTIAAWQALFDERTLHGATASVNILLLAYSDHKREVSGKAFDFSPESARLRWQAGYHDLHRALGALEAGRVVIGQPGLSVHTFSGESNMPENLA